MQIKISFHVLTHKEGSERKNGIKVPSKWMVYIGNEVFTSKLMKCFLDENLGVELEYIKLGSEAVGFFEFLMPETVGELLSVGQDIKIGEGPLNAIIAVGKVEEILP